MDWMALLTLLGVAVVAVLCVLIWRGVSRPATHDVSPMFAALREELARGNERIERELRGEIGETARIGRSDVTQQLGQFQQVLATQLTSVATLQNNQIDTFAQQLTKLTETNTQQLEAVRQSLQQQAQQAREEQGNALRRFGDTMQQQLAQLAEGNERRLSEVRATLEQKLKDIEANNAIKLDEMRRTVDEKLHATLETRLTESFGNVTRMLAQVHQGLGDMNKLAADVGGLQRVLTNVKSRGVFGEVQLAGLLEQVFAPDQYAGNVATVPGSGERVEFAVRFPGSSNDAVVWLPIDAKFPREDYERLLDAQERADAESVKQAGDALERAVRKQAQEIRKYIAVPHTTEFAIMFLPTEGLYAEVLRRPGLFEAIQRDQRITIAGPTTLLALLTSLQVGFRTVAIEKRSAEVWNILANAKREFGKFGDVMDSVKTKLEQASKQIDQTGVRTRAIERSLREVESLPSGGEPTKLLGGDEAE